MPIPIEDICQIFVVKSKAAALLIFILLGILLEFVVHYSLQISLVYTHFFYLIIILAAIWYKRKAVYLAAFFGLLHITVYYLITGAFSYEPVFRALMFCIIAYIVGSVVQCMTHFRDELAIQNTELESTKEAFRTANKKLNLLSSITRHDILNHLTALLGYLEISKDITTDKELQDIINKEEHIADAIRRQVEFTRTYQDIGIREPIWHSLQDQFSAIKKDFHDDSVTLQNTMEPVEIFADPLFPLICQNLVDNTIRHGGNVRTISFSTKYDGTDLIFIYEDDGEGVPVYEKEKIFERGYGKNTGMGLFLSQEILAITNLSMKETGTYGSGARFEITVPQGNYREIQKHS